MSEHELVQHFANGEVLIGGPALFFLILIVAAVFGCLGGAIGFCNGRLHAVDTRSCYYDHTSGEEEES